MTYAVVPVLLLMIYCLFVVSLFYPKGGGCGSVEQLRVLLTDDNLLLADWVHFLAFYLLIGFTIVHPGDEHKLLHLLIIPCLSLTFLFGPVGYVLYELVKFGKPGSPARAVYRLIAV